MFAKSTTSCLNKNLWHVNVSFFELKTYFYKSVLTRKGIEPSPDVLSKAARYGQRYLSELIYATHYDQQFMRFMI